MPNSKIAQVCLLATSKLDSSYNTATHISPVKCPESDVRYVQ